MPNAVRAVLTRVTDRGPYRRLEFDAGTPLVAYAIISADTLLPAVGQSYCVAFPAEAIHLIP